MSSLYLRVYGHTKHIYVWRCVQHLKHSNLFTINLKLPRNVDIKPTSASAFGLVSSCHCCATFHLLPDRVTFQRLCSYLKTVLQRLFAVVPLAVRQRLHLQQNTALAHNKENVQQWIMWFVLLWISSAHCLSPDTLCHLRGTSALKTKFLRIYSI